MWIGFTPELLVFICLFHHPKLRGWDIFFRFLLLVDLGIGITQLDGDVTLNKDRNWRTESMDGNQVVDVWWPALNDHFESFQAGQTHGFSRSSTAADCGWATLFLCLELDGHGARQALHNLISQLLKQHGQQPAESKQLSTCHAPRGQWCPPRAADVTKLTDDFFWCKQCWKNASQGHIHGGLSANDFWSQRSQFGHLSASARNKTQ